jgi:hypothetical protein
MKSRSTGLLARLSAAGLALGVLALAAGAFGAPPDDFVTGGGFITGTPTGARGNFGVKGGVEKSGAFSGHLNYIDHSSGMHVEADSITNYVALGPTTREIDGTASIDGVPGFTFTVIVSDNGEPGSSDTFALTLSNGYLASGTLQGGNIQLHTHP